MSVASERSRYWLLTIPREDVESLAVFRDLLVSHLPLRYLICQEEKGEETGYCHIQAYVQLQNVIRLSQWKKVLPRAHCEIQKGTNEQARDYCRKDSTQSGERLTWGEFVGSKRSRKEDRDEDFLTAVADGSQFDELRASFSSSYLLQNMSKITYIERLALDSLFAKYRETDRELTVIWQYGKSGCGKTLAVRDRAAAWREEMKKQKLDPSLYVVTDYAHPWDNYRGETCVLFEEFNGQTDITVLLQYLDRYPIQLAARYANKWACWHRVYINSNKSPREVFHWAQFDQYMALCRRLTEVRQYTALGEFMPVKLLSG